MWLHYFTVILNDVDKIIGLYCQLGLTTVKFEDDEI